MLLTDCGHDKREANQKQHYKWLHVTKTFDGLMTHFLIIGASLSELHHTIWRLEMVPWFMPETNTRRHGIDHCTCRPLLCVDNGSMVRKSNEHERKR